MNMVVEVERYDWEEGIQLLAFSKKRMDAPVLSAF